MTDFISTDIVSLQFALFYRDVIERPDLEFSDINSNLMNIFDAMPSIMNIPRELPPDIPVVTLRSESNEYVCNIARARIDLHFNKLNADKSNTEVLSDFNAKVYGLLEYVLRKRDLVRFGMICRYVHPCEDPTRTIKNKYFTDSMGDVVELAIRYNKKETAQGWEINDMVEIAAANMLVAGVTKPVVFIQRDINNTVVPNKTLSKSELLEISKTYAPLITESSIQELIR